MQAKVSFIIQSAFCSTAEVIVNNLPGYIEPQQAIINIWQGEVQWICINNKYFDAPFKFTIDDNSLKNVKELWKKHENDCHH